MSPPRSLRFALWGGLVAGLLFFACATGHATILWSDLGATLVHESGSGSSFLTGSAMDILGGTVKRDENSSDTLYFKFHVDPLSDGNTEEYFAAFELFEGDTERLAVGNSLKAWAYSAFNTSETGESNKVFGDVDLHSAQPDASSAGINFNYELPRRGVERTIVFKVQYVPHRDAVVTAWLNPDLSPGATEEKQPADLTTRFKANAVFNEIHLRHGGGGGGWTFSDMAIATEFSDFVATIGSPTVQTAPELPTFSFHTWQREQGLPQNFIRALGQTRDGYLWVGNDEGMARFDGIRFTSFGLPEGLHNGRVNVLYGDSHGTLWIGSAGGGLTRLRNGQFTTFTKHDGLPSDVITALGEDRQNRLWVGTDSGLAVWDNDHAVDLPLLERFKDKNIAALAKDSHGNLWLGAADQGVFEFRDGALTAVVGNDSINALLRDPHCLLVDHSGRLWIGAGDDYILCRDGADWHRYRISRHLARPYVCALAEQPDGTVWAGSVSEGLIEFKDGKEISIQASSGLPDNFIESLLVDQEGGLWVGTDAGLNRMQPKVLFTLNQREGLGDGPVAGIAEITPGKMWVGKPNDGLFHWNGKAFDALDVADPLSKHFKPTALLKVRDGSCWVATSQGLWHFPQPDRDPADVVFLPENWQATALCEDQKEGLWAGTREGPVLHIRQGGSVVETNFTQSHPVTAIVQDPDGTLWVGTEGSGLYRVQTDGTRSHYSKYSGLVSDLVRTLFLDADHTLWVGTAGGGLSRFQHGAIRTFTTREGLPDNTASQILEDDSGHLWLGGNRGIARINKKELDDVANGKLTTIYPETFGRDDGMLSERCSGGFYPAGLKTKSGQLWFATEKGIVVINPNIPSNRTPPPRVLLEEVSVDGLPGVEFAQKKSSDTLSAENSRGLELGELQLPPGKHDVELRYTALSFNAPAQIRFRYRLEGLDSDWVEAGSRRVAPYNYLPPGHYKFSVIACNSDGVWSQPGALLTFTLFHHWWQSSWVVGSSILMMLVIVGATARFTEKRKMNYRLKTLEQERAVSRERARIAQDLHDELGSSLARISLLSGLVKSDKAIPAQVETHAQKLAQSADQTVRALEEIVWAVRPGSDSLPSLMDYMAHFATELFENSPTRCRLDLPQNVPALPLPPDVRHNIFLIVKEALTNVLKHASAKEVHVQAKLSGNLLEIRIQDDGAGSQPPIPPKIEGKRNGLINMQLRAESLGGTLGCRRVPGEGTTIRLIVPLPNLAPAQ
jgi:ligand-binding sensor domain-containing protein/signal transduction histidine kinase